MQRKAFMMKVSTTPVPSVILRFAWPVVLIMALAACVSYADDQGVKSDGFASPASIALPLASEGLKPGLAVLYFKNTSIRHIDALPKGERSRKIGRPGPPITNLNRRFGRGEVFKSGSNRLVGLEMSGFIRLEKPGQYTFQVYSNDGFRLYLDGALLVEDPAWHQKSYKNRLKTSKPFHVSDPGWYSLRIRYFQRKGTAAFQFYWQPPGEAEFQPVPSPVLAHRESY
jgi:hypothetical protein